LVNGFIGDDDPTFGMQLFDLSKNKAEPMVQPDGVADDCGGKTKTAIAGCVSRHHAGLSNPAQLGNTVSRG
jgi:hypothetical protein